MLTRAEQFKEAEKWLLAALAQLKIKFGDGSPQSQGAIEDLVALYDSSGQTALASRYRQTRDGGAPL